MPQRPLPALDAMMYDHFLAKNASRSPSLERPGGSEFSYRGQLTD
jgi:hypothetical protein